jgi:hypothetical protein
MTTDNYEKDNQRIAYRTVAYKGSRRRIMAEKASAMSEERGKKGNGQALTPWQTRYSRGVFAYNHGDKFGQITDGTSIMLATSELIAGDVCSVRGEFAYDVRTPKEFAAWFAQATPKRTKPIPSIPTGSRVG